MALRKWWTVKKSSEGQKTMVSVKPYMLGESENMVVHKHLYQIGTSYHIHACFQSSGGIGHWMQPLISARILLSCGIIGIVFLELSCQITHLSAFGKQRLHMLAKVLFGPVRLTCFYERTNGIGFSIVVSQSSADKVLVAWSCFHIDLLNGLTCRCHLRAIQSLHPFAISVNLPRVNCPKLWFAILLEGCVSLYCGGNGIKAIWW